jgi:hypothetical protein
MFNVEFTQERGEYQNTDHAASILFLSVFLRDLCASAFRFIHFHLSQFPSEK